MRGVNERLCIGEVGVDLELCVHAHGHDVDLIIKAYPKLIISVLWPFAIMVPTMFSFKYHFSCKFKHLTSAEQYASPTSTLISRRVLYSGILRISWSCITSYEFFIKYHILTNSNFPGFGVVKTLKDTDN